MFFHLNQTAACHPPPPPEPIVTPLCGRRSYKSHYDLNLIIWPLSAFESNVSADFLNKIHMLVKELRWSWLAIFIYFFAAVTLCVSTPRAKWKIVWQRWKTNPPPLVCLLVQCSANWTTRSSPFECVLFRDFRRPTAVNKFFTLPGVNTLKETKKLSSRPPEAQDLMFNIS